VVIEWVSWLSVSASPVTTENASNAFSNPIQSDLSLVASYERKASESDALLFTLIWEVSNHVHDVTDLKLTASLPPAVQWTGRTSVSAGELSSGASLITWTLNRMPKDLLTPIIISFDLSVPKEESLSELTLVGQSQLTGKDTVTGKPITFSGEPVMYTLQQQFAEDEKSQQ